ncbi:hypothetical protein BKA61DRAFT_591450 [Leptodontidium sp. MPI-SDFR-AT-0119]|nr:hypothetical protein BKA61DRAFT_591450 [Leptodontidium sp. MPI-SDFR-AT-0119]
MMTSKSKKAATKKAINAEMKLLAPKLGSLSTYEEIAEASELLATTRVPGTENHKWVAIRNYVESKANRDWIWVEIELYRMIGQTSSFLLDGPKLDRDPEKSESENDSKLRTLGELELVIQTWSYLALEGALGHLLMHEDVHEVKEQGGSAAELFRAFLRAHNVEVWNEQELYDVWSYVYKFAEDFRRVKRERISPSPDVTRRSGLVAVRDDSSAVAQLSNSRGSRTTTNSSLKHGLLIPENVRSKRLRSSNIAKENPAPTVTTEESIDKDPFMYIDEDIYNASPPPATSSAVRRSSPTPQSTSSALVATIGASRTEPVRETPGLQRQANGNSKSLPRTNQNGSERPEDFFLTKVSKVTEDLKSARNKLDITNQALGVTREHSEKAGKFYEHTYCGMKHRFREVEGLCYSSRCNMTSTSIRAAAKACKDFGLAEGESLMALLEPVLAYEEAKENRDKSISKFRKLENKLTRLSEIFDED